MAIDFTLTPEQRLCVRDLWMPKGANAVSLRLGTNGRPPTRVVLTLADGATPLAVSPTLRLRRARPHGH